MGSLRHILVTSVLLTSAAYADTQAPVHTPTLREQRGYQQQNPDDPKGDSDAVETLQRLRKQGDIQVVADSTPGNTQKIEVNYLDEEGKVYPPTNDGWNALEAHIKNACGHERTNFSNTLKALSPDQNPELARVLSEIRKSGVAPVVHIVVSKSGTKDFVYSANVTYGSNGKIDLGSVDTLNQHMCSFDSVTPNAFRVDHKQANDWIEDIDSSLEPVKISTPAPIIKPTLPTAI